MSAVDAIVDRHRKDSTWDSGNPEAVDGYVTWCRGCGQRPWPCDTALIAEDWKRLRRALVQVTDLLDENRGFSMHSMAGTDEAIAAARALLAEGAE